jgi:hypothetical protein
VPQLHTRWRRGEEPDGAEPADGDGALVEAERGHFVAASPRR